VAGHSEARKSGSRLRDAAPPDHPRVRLLAPIAAGPLIDRTDRERLGDPTWAAETNEGAKTPGGGSHHDLRPLFCRRYRPSATAPHARQRLATVALLAAARPERQIAMQETVREAVPRRTMLIGSGTTLGTSAARCCSRRICWSSAPKPGFDPRSGTKRLASLMPITCEKDQPSSFVVGCSTLAKVNP
jgi:hypothetical protein